MPEPPAWAFKLHTLTQRLINVGPESSRQIKLAWVINFQKAGTLPFLCLLMIFYQNNDPAAWVYLALHGSYGLVWLVKDLTFPDPAWQKYVSPVGAMVAFCSVLAWYWVFGWLLISAPEMPRYPLPDAAWFAMCICLCVLGCAIMMAADAQKYYVLRLKSGLISDGMFKRVRHPNYLGEIMIYASFALMVGHWLPWVVLAWVWLGVFAVNMSIKEASLSRYPGWTDYRNRTGWLIPRFGHSTGLEQRAGRE